MAGHNDFENSLCKFVVKEVEKYDKKNDKIKPVSVPVVIFKKPSSDVNDEHF